MHLLKGQEYYCDFTFRYFLEVTPDFSRVSSMGGKAIGCVELLAESKLVCITFIGIESELIIKPADHMCHLRREHIWGRSNIICNKQLNNVICIYKYFTFHMSTGLVINIKIERPDLTSDLWETPTDAGSNFDIEQMKCCEKCAKEGEIWQWNNIKAVQFGFGKSSGAADCVKSSLKDRQKPAKWPLPTAEWMWSVNSRRAEVLCSGLMSFMKRANMKLEMN